MKYISSWCHTYLFVQNIWFQIWLYFKLGSLIFLVSLHRFHPNRGKGLALFKPFLGFADSQFRILPIWGIWHIGLCNQSSQLCTCVLYCSLCRVVGWEHNHKGGIIYSGFASSGKLSAWVWESLRPRLSAAVSCICHMTGFLNQHIEVPDPFPLLWVGSGNEIIFQESNYFSYTCTLDHLFPRKVHHHCMDLFPYSW